MFSCCAAPPAEGAEVNLVPSESPVEEPVPPLVEEEKPTPVPEPEEPKPEPILEPEEPKLDPIPEPILEVEEPKEEPAPPAYQEWTIEMQKPGSHKLGITLGQVNPKCCVVKQISDSGYIKTWNAANPAKAIKPGDAIIELNGKTGESNIMSEIKGNDTLNMKIRRAETFVIKVDKSTHKLGVKLSGPMAEITAILPDGGIEEHNKSCEAGFVVIPRDQVLEVNGVGGTGPEVLQAASAATGVVELKIRHP